MLVSLFDQTLYLPGKRRWFYITWHSTVTVTSVTPENKSGNEAESAVNALTILEHGYPTDGYLGLPIYENVLA